MSNDNLPPLHRAFIDKNGGYQSTYAGDAKLAHDAWVKSNTWGLSRDDFIRLSYFHGSLENGSDGSGPINGNEDRPGDVVYEHPEKGCLTRFMVSGWLSNHNSFTHGYKKALEAGKRDAVAASGAGVPAGWQPIETAPNDGSEVLLYLGAPWNKVVSACWFELWENWQRAEDMPDPDDEYCGIGSDLPTHWQPLPSAPLAAAPTPDSDGGEPLVTPKHIEEIKDLLLWPVTEDDARAAREMLQSLHFDLSMAESTPSLAPAVQQGGSDAAGAWPAEPTPEMQHAGASAIRFDTTIINKLWTANAVYRAMRAAMQAQAGDAKGGAA